MLQSDRSRPAAHALPLASEGLGKTRESWRGLTPKLNFTTPAAAPRRRSPAAAPPRTGSGWAAAEPCVRRSQEARLQSLAMQAKSKFDAFTWVLTSFSPHYYAWILVPVGHTLRHSLFSPTRIYMSTVAVRVTEEPAPLTWHKNPFERP